MFSLIVTLWLVWLFVWLFILGCAVGSFLNVCIWRLPRGKNLFWPSSRCGVCLTPIRASDNIPLISYWRLRGHCRACGATFSMRYFWLELATGLVFVALYAGGVCFNLHGQYVWEQSGFGILQAGLFPPYSWAYFVAAGLLASLLIVAGCCLVEVGEVPRGLVVTGAVCGLAWSLFYPWPSPTQPRDALALSEGQVQIIDGARGPMPPEQSWAEAEYAPRPGFVPWPVWGPLPAWTPPNSLLLGLVTGLAGLLLGSWLLRGVDASYHTLRGYRAFGPAPPALVLMTGGFLGWQPVMTALALAVVVALTVSLFIRLSPPGFALVLLAALVITWLGWAWLGPAVYVVLFDTVWLMLALALLVGLLFVLAGRLIPPDPGHPSAGQVARSFPLPPQETRHTPPEHDTLPRP